MITFIGQILLPNNSPKTLQELIIAAINNRPYANATVKAEAASRYRAALIEDGYIQPNGANVYMLDAIKGVTGGVCDATKFTLPDDFTLTSPGGAVVLQDGESRHFSKKTPVGSRILYQNSGAAITIDLDVKFFD